MGRANRKKPLAALAGTAGAVIALTVLTPGVASAQSGSRLCGTSWKSVKSGEIITRIYEVPKNEAWTFVCERARRKDVAVAGSPFANRLKDKNLENWATFVVNTSRNSCSWRYGCQQVTLPYPSTFAWVFCEAWRDRAAELGGLGGRDLNFIGDNFPKQRSQADICKNMNRSDTIFDMERYWLYDDNDPATKTVDFQRG
jgi:hypothetical protein